MREIFNLWETVYCGEEGPFTIMAVRAVKGPRGFWEREYDLGKFNNPETIVYYNVKEEKVRGNP